MKPCHAQVEKAGTTHALTAADDPLQGLHEPLGEDHNLGVDYMDKVRGAI